MVWHKECHTTGARLALVASCAETVSPDIGRPVTTGSRILTREPHIGCAIKRGGFVVAPKHVAGWRAASFKGESAIMEATEWESHAASSVGKFWIGRAIHILEHHEQIAIGVGHKRAKG